MLMDTNQIYKKVACMEVDEVVYLEIPDIEVGMAVTRRLTAASRFAKAMKHQRFSCRHVLAVETANKTQLLIRIERIK